MASREGEAAAAQPLTSDHDKETNWDAILAVEVDGQVGLKREVTLLNGIALVIGVISAQAFSSHPKVHSLGPSRSGWVRSSGQDAAFSLSLAPSALVKWAPRSLNPVPSILISTKPLVLHRRFFTVRCSLWSLAHIHSFQNMELVQLHVWVSIMSLRLAWEGKKTLMFRELR